MAITVDKNFVAKLLGEPVKELTIAAGAQLGDNVAGDLKALTVETESGQKLNLMYKSMFGVAPFVRSFLIESGCFRTEKSLYSSIAPSIQRLAESRGVPQLGELPFPRFYGGFNDDENDYLCMQNMRPEGFVMSDKYVGLDLDETTLVMKELGRFHALGYALLHWEGEKYFEKEPDFKFLIRQIREKEIEFSRGLAQVVRNCVDLIKVKDPELGEKALGAIAVGKPEELFGTAIATDSKYFPTIIHGDLWVNNILYKKDKSGKAVDLRLIDFQQTRRGNIFEDLQYFFFTSTTRAFRKRHLSEVLDVYYNSFVYTVDSLNFPRPMNFTRGFFIDSLLNSYLIAYRYMCFAIPIQLGAPMDFESGPPPGTDGAPAGPPPGTDGAPGGPTAEQQFQIETQMLIASCKMRLEGDPRAVERLMDLTRELVELKIL